MWKKKKRQKIALNVSAVELICCSLAIFTALQEIPHNEIHETISYKNEGSMHTEKHLTW